MTDRAKGLTVALSTDIRVDDVQAISDAILMIKGVCAVEVNVANVDDFLNRMRIRTEIAERILTIVDEIGRGK